MSDTITIRLSEKERSKLESTSKKTSLTVSQLVREAVRRYLAVERFRELRAETISYAERAGFFTDEDILEK
ncbi:MAG: ribbon-helix-helix domain-containing protein [Candidatus Omnitrophica bacterium]|nr:ribbon-helix-helix domain-containing protein [Candidatus Omnitrophota bacterium]MBU1047990.1 ribbon-helix-helix domain-containing protein [Candidatus Omnitrophota bacterium]MBU1630688.1 ribbon-helix-helix domain-containing protein [Candidatus Omnitrophota bacterium]MBU1767165.1 ribbon-helix-helix domain-containing protein [Candidatus Omnitrophota bacterium]MBU1889632.1 ribbon-helix-helix domain-containing protein [Candidatus Omnitrophota bacterium]